MTTTSCHSRPPSPRAAPSYSSPVSMHEPARLTPRRRLAFAPVSPPPEVVAGSVALATPFFVAAVLFGERIVRQRRCPDCGGSGLVRYGTGGRFWKRCAKCGGFLPWQSWKRFFLG